MKCFPDCKIKDVDQVVYHIRWSNLIDRNQFDSKIEWIAANDCMINLKTGETKPHSPEFMTTVRIPNDYFINIPPLPTPVRGLILIVNIIPANNHLRLFPFVTKLHEIELFRNRLQATGRLETKSA